MTELQISVFDKNGELKCQASDQDQAIMVFEGTYEEGDTLVFETSNTGAFYVIRIDDCMDESLVYLTSPKVVYTIPFNEKKISYNPKCFTGERHYVTMRTAEEYEVTAYRNLAKNVMTSMVTTAAILTHTQMLRPEASPYLLHAMRSTVYLLTLPTVHGHMSPGASTCRMTQN